ncbi:hypothetical protein C7271_03755 [filamentous cyanobacterium CCP5]|nr:hypothetical protein C7271_03755 [filamentous cyanobacterium CCP5]
MQRPIYLGLLVTAPLLLACGSAEIVSDADQQAAQELLETGQLLYAEGDTTSALINYRDAIDRNPNNPVAYANRAGLLAAQQNYPKAIADYTCAINLNPELAGAYGGRGLARHYNGDTNAGVDDLWQAAQLFRDQGRMNDFYATIGIIQRLAP